MPSLSEILRTKLIPWSQQNAGERFIIGRRKMHQADMPYGVQLVPHKIQSERLIVKDRRSYNNVRNLIARWPDAGVYELGKYVLVCVLEGYADYTLSNYKVRCGPGHFIFIPPGILHSSGGRPYVDLEKSTSCEIITFLLHPRALECWISQTNAQETLQSGNCLILHEHVVSLSQVLIKEVSSEEHGNLQFIEKLLNPFLGLLLREVEAGRFQSINSIARVEKKNINASSTDFLKHLRSYVQTNLRKPLTLDVISAEMYFSPTHFTRIMRRETGKSFNEYLAEQRIEEAKVLLRNTDWTITTIASLVGIKSPSYFRTFFKHHVGTTPTAFRLDASPQKRSQKPVSSVSRSFSP